MKNKKRVNCPLTSTDLVLKMHRTWGNFNPRDRVVESKKVYNRKREKRRWDNGSTL